MIFIIITHIAFKLINLVAIKLSLHIFWSFNLFITYEVEICLKIMKFDLVNKVEIIELDFLCTIDSLI